MSVADIISPGDLLQAFGAEPPLVAGRLQRLLLPSYFPNSEDGPSLVAHLLRISPAAGVAFCTCLCGFKGGVAACPNLLKMFPYGVRVRVDHFIQSSDISFP